MVGNASMTLQSLSFPLCAHSEKKNGYRIEFFPNIMIYGSFALQKDT
jgi:hypothetical protein